MAADQRRKRLNGASIRGSSSRQQHRVKRTNLGSPHNDSDMKSHISLEWDGYQKRVVAKREQIGIIWRDLRPFNDSVPHHQNTVADVFAIPREIFELENLAEVLSPEVLLTSWYKEAFFSVLRWHFMHVSSSYYRFGRVIYQTRTETP